ncbi:LPD38 domain-containing protein [Feifania hominis]|uniref:Large polyvalent protein associated domain-containing protein n=1 Tax=Feifania hominis TaxID=2763660 RepID=A0A926HW46_9FIRM|nr:LPD38 domain-containing protein [Feifania hominis]MBC8537306.1 hypothetical protein [Feifania hominis]
MFDPNKVKKAIAQYDSKNTIGVGQTFDRSKVRSAIENYDYRQQASQEKQTRAGFFAQPVGLNRPALPTYEAAKTMEAAQRRLGADNTQQKTPVITTTGSPTLDGFSSKPKQREQTPDLSALFDQTRGEQRSSEEINFELENVKQYSGPVLEQIMLRGAPGMAQDRASADEIMKLAAQYSQYQPRLKALNKELDEAQQREHQQLLDAGYRDANLGDLTGLSAERGYYNARYGQEMFNRMMGLPDEADKYREILESDRYKYISNGWGQEAISGAASLIGQQARQITDPETLALVTSGIGVAALSGQAPGLNVLPEEVITVPAAVAAAIQAGSTKQNFEIEAGLAYDEMVQNGISHETAKKIALGVGTVNSALEFVQTDQLLKSFRTLARNSATKSTAQKIGEELLRRGVDIAGETAQEVAQEGSTIAGAQLASKLETGKWAYDKDEVRDRLADTAASSALSFGGLNVVSAGRNLFTGRRTATAQNALEQSGGLDYNNNNGGLRNGAGETGLATEHTAVPGYADERVGGVYGVAQERQQDSNGNSQSGISQRSGRRAAYPEMSSGWGAGRRDAGLSHRVELIDPETRQIMNERGFADLGLEDSTGDNASFSLALDEARRSNIYGGFVDGHTAQQLDESGTKTMLSQDRTAGVAVEPDGNITGVFKNRKNHTPKAVRDLLITAIANGGNKLDCYVADNLNNLADKYMQLGFVPVARMDFNPAYAENWKAEWGTPDVVFFVHNGDSPAEVARRAGSYPGYTREQLKSLPTFTDYDEAAAYRDSLLSQQGGQGNGRSIGGQAETQQALSGRSQDSVRDEGDVEVLQAQTQGATENLPQEKKSIWQRAAQLYRNKVRPAGRYLYSQLVSGQAELERASKDQRRTNAGAATMEDYVQLVRQAGQTVDFLLQKGLSDIDGNIIGPSFDEVFSQIPDGERAAFQQYMEHLNNINRDARGKPVLAVTGQESAIEAARLEAEHPNFSQYRDQINQYWDQFMQEWAVGSGLVAQDIYTYLKELYPNYIPTYREGKQDHLSQSTGVYADDDFNTRVASVIKTATGDTSPIMDMRDAFAKRLNQIVRAARKNALLLELAQFVKNSPSGSKYGRIVGTPSDLSVNALLETGELELADTVRALKNGTYQLTAFENGEPITINVTKQTYDAVNDLFNRKYGTGTRVGRTVTTPMKSLITGHNPFFALRNSIKDAQTGYAHSIANNPGKFSENILRAAKKMMDNSPEWQTFQALGGRGSGFFNAEKGYVKSSDPGGIVKRSAKKVWDGMAALNEGSETVTRFAEYLNAIDKFGDTPDGRKRAISAAADVTTNFSRSGPMGKAIDSWVLYFNAGVQGLDKMARQLKNRPTSTLAKAAGTGVAALALSQYIIPALLGAAGNDDNPYYEDLDNRTKDLYYLIPNAFDRDEDGYPKSFIKIPKSREYGILLVALFQRAARFAQGEDFESAFEGWTDSVKTNILPPNPLTDNAFEPLLSVMPGGDNKDFAGRVIVPESMQDLEPRYQYDSTTSEIAKALGDWFNLSPKQIDYLIKSYTGVIGDTLLPATTGQQSGLGGVLKKVLVSPIEKQFVADPLYQSGVTSRFYREMDELRTEAKTKNFVEGIPGGYVTPEEKKLSVYTKAASRITELRKQEKELLGSMPDNAERKKKIDDIRREIIAIAKGTKEEAEQVYREYVDSYVPELSYLSDSMRRNADTAMNVGITAGQFVTAYEAQKNVKGDGTQYSASRAKKEAIDKALPAMSQERRRVLYELFGVSKKVW